MKIDGKKLKSTFVKINGYKLYTTKFEQEGFPKKKTINQLRKVTKVIIEKMDNNNVKNTSSSSNSPDINNVSNYVDYVAGMDNGSTRRSSTPTNSIDKSTAKILSGLNSIFGYDTTKGNEEKVKKVNNNNNKKSKKPQKIQRSTQELLVSIFGSSSFDEDWDTAFDNNNCSPPKKAKLENEKPASLPVKIDISCLSVDISKKPCVFTKNEPLNEIPALDQRIEYFHDSYADDLVLPRTVTEHILPVEVISNKVTATVLSPPVLHDTSCVTNKTTKIPIFVDLTNEEKEKNEPPVAVVSEVQKELSEIRQSTTGVPILASMPLISPELPSTQPTLPERSKTNILMERQKKTQFPINNFNQKKNSFLSSNTFVENVSAPPLIEDKNKSREKNVNLATGYSIQNQNSGCNNNVAKPITQLQQLLSEFPKKNPQPINIVNNPTSNFNLKATSPPKKVVPILPRIPIVTQKDIPQTDHFVQGRINNNVTLNSLSASSNSEPITLISVLQKQNSTHYLPINPINQIFPSHQSRSNSTQNPPQKRTKILHQNVRQEPIQNNLNISQQHQLTHLPNTTISSALTTATPTKEFKLISNLHCGQLLFKHCVHFTQWQSNVTNFEERSKTYQTEVMYKIDMTHFFKYREMQMNSLSYQLLKELLPLDVENFNISEIIATLSNLFVTNKITINSARICINLYMLMQPFYIFYTTPFTKKLWNNIVRARNSMLERTRFQTEKIITAAQIKELHSQIIKYNQLKSRTAELLVTLQSNNQLEERRREEEYRKRVQEQKMQRNNFRSTAIQQANDQSLGEINRLQELSSIVVEPQKDTQSLSDEHPDIRRIHLPVKHEPAKDENDVGVNLEWINNCNDDVVVGEVVNYSLSQIKTEVKNEPSVSPVDSGLGSPASLTSFQNNDNYKCLCGNEARFHCACDMIYCSIKCQMDYWKDHWKVCSSKSQSNNKLFLTK